LALIMIICIESFYRHHTRRCNTYSSLLGDKTSSMLAVRKGLKQEELRVHVHHLAVKQ
jgi:hypothetical protein